jgi:hypothetical protein
MSSGNSKVRLCTVTGADESVDPFELVKRIAGTEAHRRGMAEIGVLWGGPEKEGRPRYPGIRWLRELALAVAQPGMGVQLALHLCSRAEKAVNEWPAPLGTIAVEQPLEALGFPSPGAYTRFQFNRALGSCLWGREHFDAPRIAAMASKLNFPAGHPLAGPRQRQLIAQVKTPADWAMREVAECGFQAALHDASGGTGELPAAWPRARPAAPALVGFAGGLGPHNIKEELGKIAEAAGGHDFWVDMETGLRAGDGSFHLPLALHVLDACREHREGAVRADQEAPLFFKPRAPLYASGA